jgi:cell division protein FtsB
MSLLQRKILTVGLVLVLVWLGYKTWQIRGQSLGLGSQVKDLENRVADLKQNNQFLASSSAYFASDAYLERQARLKLNYKLADEQVAFVYPVASSSAVPASASAKASLLSGWREWFANLFGQFK